MKSKLNKVLIDKICEYIEKGHYIKRACALCDISEWAFYRWLEKGEEALELIENNVQLEAVLAENLYAQFHEAIKKAEARCQEDRLQRIDKAVKERKSWEGEFRFLESRFPHEWAKHEVVHQIDENEGLRTIKKLLVELRKPKVEAIEGEYKELIQSNDSESVSK